MSSLARSIAALFLSVSLATSSVASAHDEPIGGDEAQLDRQVALELPTDLDHDLLDTVTPVVTFGFLLELLEPQALCAVQGLPVDATGGCEMPHATIAS